MRIVFEPVDGVDVERMVVHEAEEHHAGEVVGYRCQHCGCADETLKQIFHGEECPLAGEHGRQIYDELDADIKPDCPELKEENRVWAVKSAETDHEDGVHNGDIVAFVCDHCSNSDESLFEIVHDEPCPLADANCKHGSTDPQSLRVTAVSNSST